MANSRNVTWPGASIHCSSSSHPMRLSLKRVGHFHWDRVGSLKVVVAGDFRGRGPTSCSKGYVRDSFLLACIHVCRISCCRRIMRTPTYWSRRSSIRVFSPSPRACPTTSVSIHAGGMHACVMHGGHSMIGFPRSRGSRAAAAITSAVHGRLAWSHALHLQKTCCSSSTPSAQ